ncbi:MAG TPA: efflux RND transporter permease subunit [Chryseolinea sp.]|nr:efflux RND transporter permease subunit [Chryseolinea sp.]
MNLLQAALRKPITVLVAVLAIVFFSVLAIRNMKVDIFPTLGLPTIYVAQPYGGLSPEQMEGFITSYYEYHNLYVTGVKFVESKSIQGAAILKIQFQDDTDMSQAMAEVVGYVNRSRAFMPPGTIPPFITRFDAGSVPVGQLVFTSEARSLSEISDLALFRVRPMFATLPGVSAPPPFGWNQKTVIIKVDPEKIKNYKLSPDEVVQAVAKSNVISPAGNVRIGDETVLTPQNTIVENIKELESVPITLGAGPAVYVRDIATVQLGSDVTTSYALINGKRSVYIPVTKRSTASTWDVVKRVKTALPDMQAAIPEDIKVSYEFDQSGYVMNALTNLLFEGGLGSLLTGVMVLLFLDDRRSALIIVLTIPLALLTGVTFLFLAGQTINIMTLGGLALAVGILVDEGTITIENIHRHQEMGKAKARAIIDACREIVWPKLLILLCILAVFVPSIFMTGVPKGMFVPLSLSVAFAMIASFFLSNTFVPVMANWILRDKLADHKSARFDDFRATYLSRLDKLSSRSGLTIAGYSIISIILLAVLSFFIGKEIFPKADAGQAVVRLRLPVGTRMERTEEATQKVLALVDSITNHEVEITSAFVGTQPSSYPVNLIHLWTSGPHEAVVRINLRKNASLGIEDLKERLRNSVKRNLPSLSISFEPGDIVDQVINLGSTNPVEIAITSRNFAQTRALAEKLEVKLKDIDYLRDVQIATPLDYPSIKIDIDRVKAGQLGLTVDQISKSTIAATSSSRFTQPNYWLDKTSGTAYQVQVEYPQYQMNSADDIELIPVSDDPQVYLRDVARWSKRYTPGEYDRLNQQRFITITGNIHDKDLGSALEEVNASIASLGELPTGVKIFTKGQSELMKETMSSLQSGLIVAIVVIFLLLSVNFQSFRLALVTLSIVPAVIAGSLFLLLITGKTLNIQSYMGMIMAVGVAIANAILFITNAEQFRKEGRVNAYHEGAFNRLRPILMTGCAMIAGMIPMSLGLGEGGSQVAPLGIAVIGGLLFSLVSTLLILPLLYQRVQGTRIHRSASLDPDDMESRYYQPS